MYLDYFGLQRKPFLITPDPAFLYPSSGHQQALAHLHYGLQREGGFMLLTGEVGTGKTTLCNHLIEHLPTHFRLAYLLNTRLDSDGVLRGICRELGIALRGEEDGRELVERVYDNLLAAYAEQKQTLVIIEEAQNLDASVLETLRLLTNLETTSTKLLHILLVGQPELLQTLQQTQLRQLSQRVVARSHLGALTRQELTGYIQRRLHCAGTTRPLFSQHAITLVHRRTGGIPRLVNQLAEHALMGAYATGQPQVTSLVVRRAAKELNGVIQSASRTGLMKKAGLVAAGIAGVATVTWAASFYTPIDPQTLFAVTETPVQSVTVLPEVAALSESSAADTLDPVKVEAEPMSKIRPALSSAFSLLLAAWSVDAPIRTVDDMCREAESAGLRCTLQTVETLADLNALARPMVLTLNPNGDAPQVFALTAISDNRYRLHNSSGEHWAEASELMSAMPVKVQYLWRPPIAYSKPIKPGEYNPELLTVLMDALQQEGLIPSNVVTGGIYNEWLQQQVKQFQSREGLDVDGIVGDQTLIHLLGSAVTDPEGSAGEEG